MASVMTGVYFSGLQALEVQGERMLLDSALRSRMELLLSEKFDQLASGTDTATVTGQNYTITWTVATVDLNGDATPEPTAKQVTVTLEGRSLTTIVVDNEDRVGKI